MQTAGVCCRLHASPAYTPFHTLSGYSPCDVQKHLNQYPWPGPVKPAAPLRCPEEKEHYSMPLCNAQTGISVLGGPLEAHSPLVHVRLAGQPEEPDEAEAALQRVADAALARGLLIVVHRVSNLDKFRGAPSLRCVPAAVPAYVKDCFDVLGAAPDAHDDAGSG